jgi:hypothetical protein
MAQVSGFADLLVRSYLTCYFFQEVVSLVQILYMLNLSGNVFVTNDYIQHFIHKTDFLLHLTNVNFHFPPVIPFGVWVVG